MYFKSPENTLHFLSDEDIVNGGKAYLPVGCVEISDAEAGALHAPSLEQIKDRQLATINAARDRREEAGFPYRGKVLDSTPRSVQRITAAALAAQAILASGKSYSVDWTCADNSTLTLDAAGIIGMPVALAQHAAALHDHARSLKAAVDAADSEAALAAIDIQAGWPAA